MREEMALLRAPIHFLMRQKMNTENREVRYQSRFQALKQKSIIPDRSGILVLGERIHILFLKEVVGMLLRVGVTHPCFMLLGLCSI
jgi:hypothetical protein